MSAAAPRERAWDLVLALTCLLPTFAALFMRPPVPLDELRYLAVGWEMWRDGNFLVPHINGATYAHKPPILFWLMHAGWAVLGVNDWWPRLIGGMAVVAGVLLTRRFARSLWPRDAAASELAPWLLAGCLVWLVCGQMLMFDILLSAWVALGMWAVWRTATHERLAGWWLIGVAIGGGVLTKGPIVLLQVLLPAVLAPLWQAGLRQRPWHWYARLLGALLLGAALALAWAIPAAIRGGPDYAAAIFWHQTAGRMENSFAHARPWWFYLPALPLLFLPWAALPGLWRRAAGAPREAAIGFLLVWVASVVVALSLVSGKQPQYAAPLMPALALLGARLLGGDIGRDSAGDRRALLAVLGLLVVAGAGYLLYSARQWGAPWTSSGVFWLLPAVAAWAWVARRASLALTLRRGALAMAIVVATLLAGFAHSPAFPGLDLRRPAQAVRELQAGGALVAALDNYQGQFTFLGRLERPLVEVRSGELGAWAAAHPGAYVLAFKKATLPGVVAGQVAEFPYRSSSVRIWRLGSAGAAGLSEE